jgi:hypothetical protein
VLLFLEGAWYNEPAERHNRLGPEVHEDEFQYKFDVAESDAMHLHAQKCFETLQNSKPPPLALSTALRTLAALPLRARRIARHRAAEPGRLSARRGRLPERGAAPHGGRHRREGPRLLPRRDGAHGAVSERWGFKVTANPELAAYPMCTAAVMDYAVVGMCRLAPSDECEPGLAPRLDANVQRCREVAAKK